MTTNEVGQGFSGRTGHREAISIALTLSETMQQALSAYQRGDLVDAERLCRKVLDVDSTHFDALHVLGIVALTGRRFPLALDCLSMAVSIEPGNAYCHGNRATALYELKRLEEAVAGYDDALEIDPQYAEAHYNRANALGELKRFDEAIASYNRAVGLRPDYAAAYYNRGNALLEVKRFAEALASYEHAKQFNPNHAELHNNRGRALIGLRRFEEAVASLDRAIELSPDYADAWINCGNTLLYDLKRYDQALASFGRALELKPEGGFVLGNWLHAKMRVCDWSDLPAAVARLVAGIVAGKNVSMPFPVLGLSDCLAVQRRAAETWQRNKAPGTDALPALVKRARSAKIRIGYFSADYHDHATAYLMAELFERHDRSQFELIAFSFGPSMIDAMRVRVAAAFDQFIEVGGLTDREVALLSRDLGVDIAVDLKGFTEDSRPGIFAYRAAPIQVNYLGYPGTMGVDYIDYLIADPTLIPEESRRHYSEKIAYLPHSYQVNDGKRRISDRVFTREELGLPAQGFVFSCFNNNYKITPEMFDVWMRLLKRVEGSVLWLLEDNPGASRNLRKEAQARGVDGARLVFAGRLPLDEHLARHRLADLFLDTLPCNAHTTASDALWAGLPVLTCAVEAFAGRVAASLLNAIGLPELVTTTQEAYEALALELATRPERLRALRQKLTDNRLMAPLFDTERFARQIEQAYTQMIERYQANLLPDHLYVPA